MRGKTIASREVPEVGLGVDANQTIVIDCTTSGWLLTLRERLDQGLNVDLVNLTPYYSEICTTIAKLRSFRFQVDFSQGSASFRKTGARSG